MISLILGLALLFRESDAQMETADKIVAVISGTTVMLPA